MMTIEQIVEEVSAWGDATFPGTTIEDLLTKLEEEHGELKEAVSTYIGPSWPMAHMGISLRKDILDEIADNFIVLFRLTKALGADFRQVVEDKWDVVKARDYSEPKTASNEVNE